MENRKNLGNRFMNTDYCDEAKAAFAPGCYKEKRLNVNGASA